MSRQPSHEPHPHRLFRYQEGHSTFGIVAKDAHKDQGINKLCGISISHLFSYQSSSLILLKLLTTSQHQDNLTYLVCMRGRHENYWTSPRDLPAPPGMHFSKEEVHKDRERPQEHIIYPICHGPLFFVLGRNAILQAFRLGRRHHVHAAQDTCPRGCGPQILL